MKCLRIESGLIKMSCIAHLQCGIELMFFHFLKVPSIKVNKTKLSYKCKIVKIMVSVGLYSQEEELFL